MTPKKKKNAERRKHSRMPAIHNLVKPIELLFAPPAEVTTVPAVLMDLSAGGMSLLTFVPIETGTSVRAEIDFRGLRVNTAVGKVVWSAPKDESWRLGIRFSEISKPEAKKINNMAIDFTDCETKLAAGAGDVCFRGCRYWKLCEKEQKLPEKK